MLNFQDIYFRVDDKLYKKGYKWASIEDKKDIIEESLKEYIQEKLKASYLTSGNIDKLSISEMVELLSKLIPKVNHDNSLAHLVHYILKLASGLQRYHIVWFEEEDISKLEITSKNDRWESLQTCREIDYATIFNQVYEYFYNNFMKEENKRLVYL